MIRSDSERIRITGCVKPDNHSEELDELRQRLDAQSTELTALQAKVNALRGTVDLTDLADRVEYNNALLARARSKVSVCMRNLCA